jgi:hypothetical protein
VRESDRGKGGTHHFLSVGREEALVVVEGEARHELALGLGVEDDLERVAADHRHLDPSRAEIEAKHQTPDRREEADGQTHPHDQEEQCPRAQRHALLTLSLSCPLSFLRKWHTTSLGEISFFFLF